MTKVNNLAGALRVGGHLLSLLLGHLPLVVHIALVSQNHPLHVGRRVLKIHTTVAALGKNGGREE